MRKALLFLVALLAAACAPASVSERVTPEQPVRLVVQNHNFYPATVRVVVNGAPGAIVTRVEGLDNGRGVLPSTVRGVDDVRLVVSFLSGAEQPWQSEPIHASPGQVVTLSIESSARMSFASIRSR